MKTTTPATDGPPFLFERLDAIRVGIVLLVMLPVFAIFRQELVDPGF